MRLSCFLLLICCCTSATAVARAQSLFLEPAGPPLTLRLETDLHALTRDRGTERKDHPAALHFGGGDTATIAVKLKTRGIFRLKKCAFPPIRLDLPSHKVDGTPFAGEDRLKLVTHCQGDRLFERNLLREYALYRAFNTVTDSSFRVRLAHVTYIDSARHDTVTRYGFLIESEAALGRRISANPLAVDNLYDPIMDPSYMTLVAVSYDFDFSGAVNAPYATPPEQLSIQSVRQRVYRGFCQPDSVLAPVLARFRGAKDSMYAAVRAVPDLPERDARDVLQYFDDFYKVLDNRGSLNREFVHGCRPQPRPR